MLKDSIEAFKELVESWSKLSKTAAIGLVLVIVSLSAGYLTHKLVDPNKSTEVAKPTDADHVSSSVTQNIYESLKIRPMMAVLLEKGEADSVGLVRYHNGILGSNEFSFVRKTMTDSVLRPGVQDPMSNVQALSATGDLPQLLDHVNHKCRYIVVTVDTPFYAKFAANGNRAMLSCPIFVPGIKNPSGYFAVMWHEPPKPDSGIVGNKAMEQLAFETQIQATAAGVVQATRPEASPANLSKPVE